MSIAQGHLGTRKGQEGRTVSKRQRGGQRANEKGGREEGSTVSKRKGREGRGEDSE